MIGHLFIDDILIGEINLKVIDQSMGVIGGLLNPLSTYNQFRFRLQECYREKGIANALDFNFILKINGNKVEVEGGIGITDSHDFVDEIEVGISGVPHEYIIEV